MRSGPRRKNLSAAPGDQRPANARVHASRQPADRLLGRLRRRQLGDRLLRRGQLDVEPERAHFLDEHVEALGNARPRTCRRRARSPRRPWCGRRRRPTSPSAFPAACRPRRRLRAPTPPFRRSAGRRTAPCRPAAAG